MDKSGFINRGFYTALRIRALWSDWNPFFVQGLAGIGPVVPTLRSYLAANYANTANLPLMLILALALVTDLVRSTGDG